MKIVFGLIILAIVVLLLAIIFVFILKKNKGDYCECCNGGECCSECCNCCDCCDCN